MRSESQRLTVGTDEEPRWWTGSTGCAEEWQDIRTSKLPPDVHLIDEQCPVGIGVELLDGYFLILPLSSMNF
jgi:hypothetical protein